MAGIHSVYATSLEYTATCFYAHRTKLGFFYRAAIGATTAVWAGIIQMGGFSGFQKRVCRLARGQQGGNSVQGESWVRTIEFARR
jgi:hypothetical protein